MATIFPPSPSVDDEYQGYKWDGTTWNLIGNQYNPASFSASAPSNPKPGDLWIESDVDVPSISPETILTTTAAASTYQPLVSGVSNTEIGYLDGVTSPIQTQINAKLDASTASTTYQTQAFGGLVLITTSTQTAAATNFLDEIFSSSYRNYKIIGDFTGTGGGGAPVAAFFKFKVGGAYSNAHYGSNVYGSYNDTVVRSINTSNAAVFHFAYTNLTVTHFEMDVHSPFINNAYKSITGQYNSVGLGIQGSFGGHAGTTSSYTGFELTLGTGNISGTYAVYGYNDGV